MTEKMAVESCMTGWKARSRGRVSLRCRLRRRLDGPPPLPTTLPFGQEEPTTTPAKKQTSATTSTTDASPTTPSSTTSSTSETLVPSCSSGLAEPTINVTTVSAQSVQAPVGGGALPNGVWLLSTVKRANPSVGQSTTWHGMVQVNGDRIAWDDEGVCVAGTYTTSGNQITLDVESPASENGTSATLYFSATATSLTLNRELDEEYDYAHSQ